MIALLATVTLAAAGTPDTAAAARTLTVSPSITVAGSTIIARGRNWERRARVQLLIGPPRSEADPVATVRTTARGSFAKRITLSRAIGPGKWILLACRRECAIKRSARFTIAATP